MSSSEIPASRYDYDDYGYIGSLDPMRLDNAFREVPGINKQNRDGLPQLHDMLVTAIGRISPDTVANKESALAALRDLDFLASSYLRHGEDPIQDVLNLEDVMIRLGEIAGTVPRGTVATYAMANPSGDRERSFTGSPEEVLFIESVRTSGIALESALERFSTDSPVAALHELEAAMQVMVNSVVDVKRGLSPAYFSDVLRPYFDPLVIGGKKYVGAGGAQLQLVAFDYVLWGIDDPDEMYNDYFNENKDYLSSNQRRLLDEIVGRQENKSLLTHLAENPDRETAAATLDVLNMFRKFRYPHRKMAQDNFKVRPEGNVGSGSYTIDILDVLVVKTGEAIRVVEELVNE